MTHKKKPTLEQTVETLATIAEEHLAEIVALESDHDLVETKLTEQIARACRAETELAALDAYVQEKVGERWRDAKTDPPAENLGYVLVRVDIDKAHEWGLQSKDNRKFYRDNLGREVDMFNTIFVRYWAAEVNWLTHWMPMPEFAAEVPAFVTSVPDPLHRTMCTAMATEMATQQTFYTKEEHERIVQEKVDPLVRALDAVYRDLGAWQLDRERAPVGPYAYRLMNQMLAANRAKAGKEKL